MFSLEALQADHGDALLLHYGDPKAPKLVVIDAGPAGIYRTSVKPRLDALRAERKPANGALRIEMVMVSHIDADHITGILDLMSDLVKADDDGKPLPYDLRSLWHNSFDLLNPGASPSDLEGSVKALTASLGGPGGANVTEDTPDGSLILLSVPQGRKLTGQAKKFGLSINPQFKQVGIVSRGTSSPPKIVLDKDLTLTVLGPNEARVEKARKEWAKVKVKKDKVKPSEFGVLVADFVDKSFANLSSIQVLAESAGKRMLLTGDGRGDDLMEALLDAGLRTKTKPCHVDLLKLPHHGSDRNVAPEYFEAITADHYVVSADGRHGNPDLPTVEMIAAARGKTAKYTVHFTNEIDILTGKTLKALEFLQKGKAGPNVKVVVRKPADSGVTVQLA